MMNGVLILGLECKNLYLIDCKSLLIFEQGARLIDACQDNRCQFN
jgi:hypothetical protein